MKFEKLLQPGQIGTVKTKNRMIKPGQSMHYATEDGYAGETIQGFYESIAKGGIGTIVVEMAAVSYPEGYPSHTHLRIDDDRFIPKLAEMTKRLHVDDTKVFLQLTHCGPSQEKVAPGVIARGPSTLSVEQLPTAVYGPTLELTIPEIEEIVDKFGRAGERARKAGFDGVEVHGAHRYLIAAFMSNVLNKRQDRYGGSPENRARIGCEVLRAIKARAGKDFPVGIRINGAEYGMEGGETIQEAQAMAPLLQEAGADYIHVSAYGYGRYNRIVQPEQVFYPEAPSPLGAGLDGSRKGAGMLVPLAAAIKKVVSVPVVAVGRLDPASAEEVLRAGKADFVAMGRFVMADPEAPRKVAEGRVEDIRPCTACLTCIGAYRLGKPVVCRANAAIGKELEYAIKPAEKKKRVMVVGGGPAGMEAARVAALRGHEVMLYDQAHRLGGSTPIVGMVKSLDVEDLESLTRYFARQLDKLGVRVTLGKPVDAALIEEVVPDVVILAAGGVATIPGIPGIDKSIVMAQARLHHMVKPYMRLFGPRTLRWLTNFYLPIGKNVAIIGGGIHGIELAEFLVKRGRKVTITETAGELGVGLIQSTKERLLPWLTAHGCVMLSGVNYEAVTDKGLAIITKEGKKQTIVADTVLTALPLKPNTELLASLKGKAPDIRVIGDAREPNLIIDAISDGFKIALTI